jgi:hypothetical protein
VGSSLALARRFRISDRQSDMLASTIGGSTTYHAASYLMRTPRQQVFATVRIDQEVGLPIADNVGLRPRVHRDRPRVHPPGTCGRDARMCACSGRDELAARLQTLTTCEPVHAGPILA